VENSERLLLANACRIVIGGGITGYFEASTQYGDWKGTVAADVMQRSSLHEWLADKGLIKPDEFLIAATLYSEHNYTSVRAFVFQNGQNFELVKDALATIEGPIPVREVDVKLTTEEFLGLFKRFHVMLTWRGLQLEGREYVVVGS